MLRRYQVDWEVAFEDVKDQVREERLITKQVPTNSPTYSARPSKLPLTTLL